MKKKNLVRLVTWPRIKVDGTIGRCSSLSRIPGIPKSSARVFEKTRIHRARSKGNERIYDVLGGIRSIYTTAQDTAGILTLISRIPDIGGIPRKWRRFPLPSRPGGTKKAKKKCSTRFFWKKKERKENDCAAIDPIRKRGTRTWWSFYWDISLGNSALFYERNQTFEWIII